VEHVLVRDRSGLGNWVLILGCPKAEFHELYDEVHQVSGPTFAHCVACKHQTGINLEACDLDAEWSLQPYPERLKCGWAGSIA